jgi:pimeloyl-ACP methyl ester carboxylesterase
MVVVLLLAGMLCGCQVTREADPRRSNNVVFVLHGIDGAGPWYNSLIGGLEEGMRGDQVEFVSWGAPLLFYPNLTFPPIHQAAERGLAARIRKWRVAHPDGRIDLVGHSAGCGVILESLAKAEANLQVDNVMLLAPAVSEKYDLAPAFGHIRGELHVFYSGRDELLPSTCVTSTYDHVFSNSGGLHGFADTQRLPAELRSRLLQHAYDPTWESLGCGGGHFGWRSKPFVEQVLAPMLRQETTETVVTRRPGDGEGPG